MKKIVLFVSVLLFALCLHAQTDTIFFADGRNEGIFRKTKYRLSCKKDLQRYVLQNTQQKKNERSVTLQPTFRCIVVCGVTGLRA